MKALSGRPPAQRTTPSSPPSTPASTAALVAKADAWSAESNKVAGQLMALPGVAAPLLDNFIVKTEKDAKAFYGYVSKVVVRYETTRRGFDTLIAATKNQLKNPNLPPAARAKLMQTLTAQQAQKAAALAKLSPELNAGRAAISRNFQVLSRFKNVAAGLAVLGNISTAFGGVTQGFSAGVNSPAVTRAGKVIDGLIAGGLNVMLNQALGKTVPGAIILGVDAFTGQNVANTFNGFSSAVAVAGEAVVTGDIEGMKNFDAKARNGDYGPLVQLGSAAGNAINTYGDQNAMISYANDLERGKWGQAGQLVWGLGQGLYDIYARLGGR